VAIIETMLALTIFRNDMNMYCFNMFVLLLSVKIFSWAAKFRISHFEAMPEVAKWEVTKIYILLGLLLLIDTLFLGYFGYGIYTAGPSVKLFFLSEYIIQIIGTVSSIVRLGYHNDTESPERDTSLFYLDIVTDIAQSICYIIFFCVIFYFYGLPIHLVRDIFTTVQSILKRLTDFYNYNRLTNNLETKIPNATPEELADKDCVICWSKMNTAKKLPCGHLFHASPCLRNWMEQSTECPLCRAPIDEVEFNQAKNPQNPRPIVEPQQENDDSDEEQDIDEIIQQVMREFPNQEPPPVIQQNVRVERVDPVGLNIFDNLKFDSLPKTESEKVMNEMYIKYLENTRVLIDETLEKLKKINQE
jgi:E3 ubiquitin-protein ligase synoviolin